MSTVLEKKTWNVLIYTMYTELSLINPMNQIHWWRISHDTCMTILVSGSDALNKYEFICMIDVHVHESFENTIWLWLKILDTYHIFVVLIISSLLLLFSFSQPISCFALLGRLNIEQMRKRISVSFTTSFRILL